MRGIEKTNRRPSMTELDNVLVVKDFRRGDTAAVQSCPVEASEIYKDVVSLLAANLRMASRDDSRGGIDCSFDTGVASEASHFFVEFDSFEALRSGS